MSEGDNRVVEFPVPVSDEERARRLAVEVERLARQSPAEWMFWLDDAAKKHGIERAKLKAMIEATVKAAEKKAREDKAEKQRREQRAEQQWATALREQERQQREQRREEERQQREADKEAENRQREREKEFASIIKLSRTEHEPRLVALAKRLDEDLEFLRDEFAQFAAVEEKSSDTGYVEPWPEPVDTQALLTEMAAQLKRYVVVHDDAAVVAVTLWTVFAWVHDEIAVYSPILALVSGDADSGKTTLCGVIKFLTPRAFAAAELTGPNLYRFVDHLHPTLIIDDADRLFERKPDLVHIVNVGWTRGTLVPRQDRGVTRWFDPFCAKVVAGVNLRLPRTTQTRCIFIRLLPKLKHEKVDAFRHVDDETFINLRRKLARWSIDNTAALAAARPVMPGLNNRAAMNLELLLAIAGRAGGDWPKRARKAAVKLAHERREPSEGKRLLARFRELFRAHGEVLTSKQVQKLLTADPDGEWADFHGRGPISQRQIAVLLDPYNVHPDYVHPHGGKTKRGYKAPWFETAFRHYLDSPARKRATVRKRGKRRK
jgi:hypothetical protein